MTEVKPIRYSLVFRPEGEAPDRSAFRMVGVPGQHPKEALDFQTWAQVGEYLATANVPEGQVAWVSDGVNIIGPEEVALHTSTL